MLSFERYPTTARNLKSVLEGHLNHLTLNDDKSRSGLSHSWTQSSTRLFYLFLAFSADWTSSPLTCYQFVPICHFNTKSSRSFHSSFQRIFDVSDILNSSTPLHALLCFVCHQIVPFRSNCVVVVHAVVCFRLDDRARGCMRMRRRAKLLALFSSEV